MSDAVPVLSDLVRGRRTVNDFQPQVPPEEAVLSALELARWAPNHKLTQPWRFFLLGRETIAKVIDLNTRLVEAAKGPEVAAGKRRKWGSVPGWLVVTCLRSDDPFRQREDYAACCCAVQNLLLGLWAQGIGSKWTTGDVTRQPEFFHLLQVDPAEHDVVGLIWYGYPAQVPASRRMELDAVMRRLP